MAAPSASSRACPRDRAPLRAAARSEVLGATIDECGSCGGLFLDKKELFRLTGDHKLEESLRALGGRDAGLACPACAGAMSAEDVVIRATEDGATLPAEGLRVTVDVCRSCFGLWLDAGEFETLRARVNYDDVVRPREAAPAAPEAPRGRRHEDGFTWLSRLTLLRPKYDRDEAVFRERSCPRDGATLAEQPMKRDGTAKVDVCPRCEGIFLDKNELKKLTKDGKLNKYLRDQVGWDSDSKLICPHCGGLMDVEVLPLRAEEAGGHVVRVDGADVPGVAVDVCLSCYGIWLDKGELDALERRRNRDAVTLSAEKKEELETTADVGRRLKARGSREQGRGVGGGVRRAGLGIDDALDEFVRRYL